MAAPTLDAVLTGLAQKGATGSLRVGKDGTLYFTRGHVSYAECADTPGVEDLLTTSGRISPARVREARQSAGAGGEGGDLLVREGVLSRGELQFCVLGATLDASFFLLQSALPHQQAAPRTRYRDGDTHWLGTHWFFDVSGLFRECVRRRSRLDGVWPSAELDTRPVVPLRRIPGKHVVLTAAQWEVLLAADATATPVELARRLGRPAYSTLLAVRELASAGLLDTGPEPGTPAPPEESPGSGTPAPPEGSPGTPAAEGSPGPGAPALPKRAAQATPRAAVRHAGADQGAGLPEVSGDPADMNLLIRLRDALEALQ
ncbi:hypothetical protein [Planotetraspora sp. GP83]|uniref:MarR family transcriptional regulator n=1 Tax=Planotetraspora sp. GP83 TaxID=3156264 RepID=UPI0035167526